MNTRTEEAMMRLLKDVFNLLSQRTWEGVFPRTMRHIQKIMMVRTWDDSMSPWIHIVRVTIT